MTLTRRALLRTTATAGIGLVVANGLRPLGLLDAAAASTATRDTALRPDPAGLLDLPRGFEYRVLSRAGTPGPGGALTPGRPDGTGAFAGRNGSVVLVRNHEQGTTATDPVLASPDLTYDPVMLGGTTTLVLDRRGRLVRSTVSIAGTSSNCAGGVTPWGTWLTCEESEARAGSGGATKDHGFVFEVHPANADANRNPTPLTALGRFAHEAAVVDPRSGDVYLTEDASGPNGLLYRCVPTSRPGGLHSLRDGGELFAMSVPGVEDLSVCSEVGTELAVTWVPVPDPMATTTSTRKQFTYVDRTNRAAPVTVTGPGGDVTRSRKLEGMWWGDGKAWIVCSFARTAGSDWSLGVHDGQVWTYDPTRSVLRLEVFLPRNPSPDGATADQPDGPDNITVNPWGGVFLAEDGEGAQHLVAVGASGRPVVFARNALSGSELTGVVFSPDGETLFAHIQDEGYTFAITGPFGRLARG